MIIVFCLISSAVHLWVAGGFVREFRWAFVARNEGQSCEKNECFCIALALRLTVVSFKGQISKHNGKLPLWPFYKRTKKHIRTKTVTLCFFF